MQLSGLEGVLQRRETPEAAEILKAAVNPDSGGQFLYIKHGLGPGHDNIQVGRAKRHMIPDDADPPTVQRWLDALCELVVAGYVSGSERCTT